jgi:LysM repeat protein
MRKGMLSGLWSLKWVLLCLLLTGCPKSDPPPPPPPPSPEITVTGQVMLGPVVGGHSLQLVIYDTEMNELNRPKIGLDGGYGFTLKDYEGAVIAQVTSTKPQQECSVGDYIDEATAKPKCLGNNSILSSTVLKLDNTSSDNQAKLHTTSVTTIAALNAGINIKEDGTIAVNDNLSPEIIDRSNKIISQALGLGDQSVAEYTPKSIITTDQKFQSGDAYSQALAEISGIEAEGKSLNSIVKVISAGIGKNGKLSPAVQDMMVKGNQKVFKKAKEQGADTSILNQINKRQDTYPDSIAKVDMVNAPEPPVFNNKTKTKTSNQKPTWEWISGGTGNERYQYRFGAEDDIQNVRVWTETSSSSFTSKDNLKPGKYILEIQEGHTSDPNNMEYGQLINHRNNSKPKGFCNY